MRNGWLPLAACLCASLLLMGCGTCPDLSYRGRVRQEDVSYIRNCVAEKNIDLANVRWYERNLALHMVLVPGYFGVEKVVIFDGLENVTTGERTGGPYQYMDIQAVGFPLTVWLDMICRAFTEEGEERSYVENKGLLAGILGSWGSFHFRDRSCVASEIGACNIVTGLAIPVSPFLPSRWYFTGTEGHFWNAPCYLFGHVSSDTSDTFHLFHGLIPIRYSNRETPDNR